MHLLLGMHRLLLLLLFRLLGLCLCLLLMYFECCPLGMFLLLLLRVILLQLRLCLEFRPAEMHLLLLHLVEGCNLGLHVVLGHHVLGVYLLEACMC